MNALFPVGLGGRAPCQTLPGTREAWLHARSLRMYPNVGQTSSPEPGFRHRKLDGAVQSAPVARRPSSMTFSRFQVPERYFHSGPSWIVNGLCPTNPVVTLYFTGSISP